LALIRLDGCGLSSAFDVAAADLPLLLPSEVYGALYDAGHGFNAEKPKANAVLVRVPTSTTFLNARVICDVINATSTTIVCT